MQRNHLEGLPAISVVIPVKDRKKALQLAVRSVELQTVKVSEVIIVDDCSAEPVSPDWFSVTFRNSIKIVRNSINLGGAASCNAGLAYASNDYVALLDSDDYLAPDYILKISEAWARSAPTVTCIAVGFWWCDNHLRPYRRQIVTTPVDYASLLTLGNFVGGSSALSVRRQTALSVGGYPLIRGSHDWGFLLRLARAGTITALPEPLLYYRSPSASILPNETKNYRKQILAVFKVARDQSVDARQRMKRQLSFLACRGLTLSKRRKWAYKLLSRHVRLYGVDRKIAVLFMVNIIGPATYARILSTFARVRARRFGISPPIIPDALQD